MVNIGKHSMNKTCVKDVACHEIKTVASGELGTLEYRLGFQSKNGSPISPWHSVPLYAGQGLLNFVCEIPRNSRAKFEVAINETNNPIKQDSKKGKPRSYAIDILWNYGMLPQTWEDPHHKCEDCDGHIGDNDPVDVVEIGDRTAVSGDIYAVKPIAALAMIDEGELDWKIIAISSEDPRCDLVNDVGDMEKHFPGTVNAIREWFRTYKTFDGKPLNQFALDEKAMNREYTLGIVSQTHGFWKSLVASSLADPASTSLAVGDVPIPLSFSTNMEDKDNVKTVTEVLDEVVDEHLKHKRHQDEKVLAAEETEIEHENKRVELVSVA